MEEDIKDINVRPFKLSSLFLEEYKNKQPKWGFNGLGYIVYKRTYARPKDDGIQEEFWETCQRVVEGCYTLQKKHCNLFKLPWDNNKAQRSAQEMFRRMWEFKWLPPGRGLWAMGVDSIIDKVGSAALLNCGFVSSANIKDNFAEPFCWMMDFSMLGVGVGFDTKGAGTVKILKPKISDEKFIVADSREGWIEILKRILNSYVGIGSIPREIDYSQVRPLGAPIKTFGGVSGGPQPLIDLVNDIQNILNKLENEHITSEAIVDLFNLIGKCVVSGNSRRSAQIGLGEIEDKNFLNLKNPDQNQEALLNHRWASNNSLHAKIGMDYSEASKLTAKNGEPGFFWLENVRNFARMNGIKDTSDYRACGTNPCGEQNLENMECCNLVETFPTNHEDLDDYLKTLKFAYLYSKTVTLIPTHHPKTNAIMMRNRRIGCSMSGITQAITKFGKRNFLNACDRGYEYISKLDKIYSEWLCIPQSIRKTSVKPSGSVSLLCGATAGIHFPHAKHYIRRVRFAVSSPLIELLREHNFPIEKDKYSPNTLVVSFPIEEESFDRSKTNVSMWEQADLAAALQQYWADNSVSVTVTFSEEESKNLKYLLESYESKLKSISLLPEKEHGYEQAPLETITEERYNELISQIKPLNFRINSEHEITERFCDSDVCMI